MYRRSKLVALTLFTWAGVATFGSTPTGADLMAKANAQATKEHKNVLVIFHASWCGWCHKLDKMLDSKDAGASMSKAYVIVHLVVDESLTKKADENPGADGIRKSLGGERAGLPFFAVVSPTGKTLATSIAPKTGNVGYPSELGEITYFMDLLKSTAPNLTDAERGKVEAYLKGSH